MQVSLAPSGCVPASRWSQSCTPRAMASNGEPDVTATEATVRAAAPPTVRPQSSTNPYLGILGVFLGAGIATLNSRLVSVGLPDLRGATGLGFDEASWIPTALNMATMFSGVFVVFLNALFGPRRILLPAAVIFTLASSLLPL